MAASDQITKLFFCASLGSAVYYLMLAFEALGWQDLMNEFQLCLGGTAWVALPGWHRIPTESDDLKMYSYGRLWSFMSYNWLFLWGYTLHKCGFSSTYNWYFVP